VRTLSKVSTRRVKVAGPLVAQINWRCFRAPLSLQTLGLPARSPPKSPATTGATLDENHDLGTPSSRTSLGDTRDFEQFDTRLFARNTHCFAFHFENAGFRELCELPKWTLAAYRRCVPETYAIAEAMFANTPMRSAWGTQIEPGRWSYEKAGNEIRTRFGTRFGKPLSLLDVLKHLTGRGGYARGTCDVPEPEHAFDLNSDVWLPNSIQVLRIDMDDDVAWRKKDRTRVLADVRSQRTVTEAFGLPYAVFATGNRGVQIVAPLPCSMPPSVTSVLLHGLRIALEARADAYSEPCADNLHSVMRLPGGVHADSRALGLWIDPDAGRLYGIEDQAKMMSSAFRFRQGDGVDDPETFALAAGKMLARLRGTGVRDHELVSREYALDALAEKPNNPISARWRQAVRSATRGGTASEGTTHEPKADQATGETNPDPRAYWNGRLAPAGRARDWAERTWREGFQPGRFWFWINNGGDKGLLAARILFGERAEEELIRLAIETPARSGAQIRQRIATIKSLCRNFREKGQPRKRERETNVPKAIPPHGVPDYEVERMAKELAERMRSAKPRARWRDGVAYAVSLAVYVGIREGLGMYQASLDVIASHATNLGGGTSVSKVNARQMLARMTDQDEDCIVPAFRRTEGNHAEGEADTYSLKLETDPPRWYA